MADFRDTLMLPFDSGALSLPSPDQRWHVLNADLLPLPEGMEQGALTCEQGMRPVFLNLQSQGYDVQPMLGELRESDVCLVLAHRSRAVNERNMMRGWNALKPGGLLVFAGDKTSGVQPMRKWAGRMVEIDGSLSKHHAVVFWLHKSGADWSSDVLQKPDSHFMQGEFKRAAGMFSADGPDAASVLLSEYFGHRIRGRVADFGSGWGYLSHHLLKACPLPKSATRP